MLTAGTALALLFAPLGAAGAHSALHPKHEQAKKERPKPLQVPLIAISIADQRLTLYDKGEAVAHAPVSTGMPGHPTPTGVFSVLSKEVFHRSNIYSGAPMPYMQRITWSGVALHAGVLPGHPASHGCIRMPPEFAVRLFGLTQRGARVIVSHGEVKPVPFDNPHLFALLRPTDTKAGELGTPAVGGPPAVKTAETRASAVMSDAADAAARTLAGGAKPGEKPGEPAAAEPPKDAGPAQDGVSGAASAAPAVPGAVLVKPVSVVSPQPIEVKKTFEPTGVPAAPTVETAPAVAPATQPMLEPYGPERPLRPGPITVFISKKEGKIFVRKGFQQILADRVTIAHPELALGTHVFTAVAAKPDGTSFDWNEVTIPTAAAPRAEGKVVRDRHGRRIEKSVAPAVAPPAPATAAEALDRIEIPPYALARISSLMSAGATLIISDQGLGSETGLETDFIVLTR